jgi:hypothetical protein
MSKNITIKWDEQYKANKGWAYDVAGGESGEIDGQAADAIDRICENIEAKDGDYAAILEASGAEAGDQLWLNLGGNSQIDLAVLLGLDG